MKKSNIIILLILVIYINSFGQSKFIYIGEVKDSLDNTSIPFCSVYLENTSIGTITNNDGAFRIVIPQNSSKNLCFSFIGYKTMKIPVAKLNYNNNLIKLSKDDIALGEIFIVPDSTLLGFLRKAYWAIKDNYSQKPTKSVGFYREALLDSKNDYLFFSEAILNVFKNSYHFSNDPGQIEIVQSRKKVFPLTDEINKNIGFYGGAFISISQDIVLQRIEFINPKHFNEYSYKLSNITKIDGRAVYEISFDTKNDTLKGSYKGKFYLDKESLAYIMAQYSYTPREISKFNAFNLTSLKLVENNELVTYFYFNSKWHLKYCRQNGKGFNNKSNSNLQLKSEFLATNIDSGSVKPIPYEKQLGFYDIYLDRATPYEETNWQDFNIIKTNDDLLFSIDQAKDVYSRKIAYSNKSKILNFLQRFNYNYGLIVFQNNTSEGLYEVYFDNNTLSQKIEDKNFIFGLEGTIGYKCNKSLIIKYAKSTSLDKNINFDSRGFGLEFLRNIKPKGKPLFLKLNLIVFKDFYGIQFSKSLKNIEYNTKLIDNSSLITRIGKESYGIRPQIGLLYQISRFVGMYLSCSYSIGVKQDYIIKFKQQSGFLKKTYREGVISEALSYNGNRLLLNTIDMYPIVLRIGFNFGFN